MENRDKYDEILVKFLLNETNETEEKFIAEWLDADQANRSYFEELSSTLRLLLVKDDSRKINLDEEWQNFQRIRIQTGPQLLSGNEQFTNERKIFPENNKAGKSKIYRLVIAGAVAASIIFVVFSGVIKFSTNGVEKNETVKNENLSGSKVKSSMAVLLHEVNTTEKVREISLPDGSQVNLFAKSEFTYRQPDPGQSREVILNGKAHFKVAKDSTRPFMVFSGDIFTTVLGTEFMVKAMPGEKQILVRLFEGKVTVRSIKDKKENKMKDAFLTPGQELVYNVNSGKGTIRSFVTDIEKATNQADNPVATMNNKKPWFMFNNQPLTSVFDDLAKMYDVTILYSASEVNKMQFIGTFNKSDSIEFILKKIASINDLDIIKEGNVYTIKKQELKPKK